MRAGFFRWRKSPIRSRKINAIMCRNFGIELIFFESEGIDFENEKITGEVFENNKWVTKTADIPLIVNNSPYRKDRKVYEFLNSRTHMMFNPFGGKSKEYNFFLDEGTLKHLLIPTTRIKNIKHVKEFLNEHKKAIFKPLSKDKGKDIFSLELKDSEYIFDDGTNRYDVHSNDFRNLYNEKIKQQRLLMSKLINSKTNSSNPFDIRINLEKNEKGKWVRAQNYARVGLNNTLVSNVDRGGGINKLNAFLKHEFSETEQQRIKDEIKEIEKKLPKIVEKMVDFEINSIGVDLGIDRDSGRIYMFEINSYPGSQFAVGQVALLRAGYMHYYLKNIAKIHEETLIR